MTGMTMEYRGMGYYSNGTVIKYRGTRYYNSETHIDKNEINVNIKRICSANNETVSDNIRMGLNNK